MNKLYKIGECTGSKKDLRLSKDKLFSRDEFMIIRKSMQ